MKTLHLISDWTNYNTVMKDIYKSTTSQKTANDPHRGLLYASFPATAVRGGSAFLT